MSPTGELDHPGHGANRNASRNAVPWREAIPEAVLGLVGKTPPAHYLGLATSRFIEGGDAVKVAADKV